MEKRPALGKGLSALIPDAPPPKLAPSEVDIDRLSPNTLQPRGQFDGARLEELAQSIKTNGVIQPIVVQRVGDRFQIIAGERRWRAAQKAGLTRVPVVVREVFQPRSQLEMALVENIQRENLNAMEEAHAYRRLADEFQLTQEAIAAAVGKDRATVANVLRLLKLPAEVQAEVASGSLSMGHARALLALPTEPEQLRVSRDVVSRKLSVRETETLVKRAVEAPSRTASKPPTKSDPNTREAEERLRLLLGTRVRIVRRGMSGRIEIDFGSEQELIRIFDQLTDG
ncbi:MAG: ParB/RepB/Spo0J family partition protein [Acidimicrobiia bacterium]|nr:ParB/RepB/Spo0J family partition protein [Acidimicrobiia bacterium]